MRGFYAKRGELLKQPLICLNNLHPPLAMTAAFWHELGHHLCTRVSALKAPMMASFLGDFEDHLEDPTELLSDIVLVLAAYPQRLALELFADDLRIDKESEIPSLISTTERYWRSEAGFRFEPRFQPTENLHYLEGMIHFAKLRVALLKGYNI